MNFPQLVKFTPLTWLTFNRYVHISNKLTKNYAYREKKIMNKLMYGSSGKKKRYSSNEIIKTPVLPTISHLSKGAYEGNKSVNSKRIAVLNKLFMKNITDLMATGEYSNEFIGRGIEISRVQTTPDFHGVNVFWVAKGSGDDEDLEHILHKNAGALRHELSQLRVMGVVPKINFVKDKQYAKSVEVDNLLEIADFGDNYIPVHPSHRLKTEFTLNSQLPEHLKKAIQEIEVDKVEEEVEPLPPMRNDVFGLNHTELMTKVKKLKNKGKALHRQNFDTISNTELSENHLLNETTINQNIVYPSAKEQRAAFENFLQKRKIIKAKAMRERDKNFSPDQEYLREQYTLRYDEDIQELEDNDYIDDNEDANYRR